MPMRLSSLGTLLRASWRIYARAYDGIFGVLLLVQLPLAAVVELVDGEVRRRHGAGPFTLRALSGPWGLRVILDAVIGVVGTMAICHLAAHTARGYRETPGGALRAAAGRWGAGIRMGLLSCLGQGLGLLFLVGPGIYLAVRWAFAPAALVLGRVGATEALRESARLVSGRWPVVFSRLLVLGMLPLLAWAALGAVTLLMTPPCFLQSVSVGFLLSVCLGYWWVGVSLLYLELKEITGAETASSPAISPDPRPAPSAASLSGRIEPPPFRASGPESAGEPETTIGGGAGETE